MDEKNNLCSNLKQQIRISNSSGTRNMKQQTMYDHHYNVNKGSSSSSWDLGNDHYNNSNSNNWGSSSSEGDLVAAGFSWPPRCYSCSFCKREFRSAQALGGHMNVHRRDRARLRQHSPTTDHVICGNNNNSNCGGGGGQFSLLNLNLEPNPSFSLNNNSNPISSPSFLPSSSLLAKFPQFTSTLPPLCPLPNEIIKRRLGEDNGGGSVQNCSSRPVTSDLMVMMMKKKSCLKGQFGDEKVLNKGDQFVRLDLEIGLISHHHHQSNYKDELDLELRLGYVWSIGN